MIYGYIRVSTIVQDIDVQRYELFKYSHSKNLKIDEFIEESGSGKQNYKKRKLGELLEKLKINDVLLVTELSRLGRNLLEVMEILNILMTKSVEVHVSKQDMKLTDNIESKVLAFSFSLASEIERGLISSRTKEALEKAKAEGKILGRPKGSLSKSKLEDKIKDIKLYLSKGVSKRAICKILDIKESTFYNFCKSRNIF